MKYKFCNILNINSRQNSIDGNSNYFKCNNENEFRRDLFANALAICEANGGMENPLTTIPILTDENYLEFAFWNISKIEVKKAVKEFAIERSKNKRHTGQGNHLHFEFYCNCSNFNCFNLYN